MSWRSRREEEEEEKSVVNCTMMDHEDDFKGRADDSLPKDTGAQADEDTDGGVIMWSKLIGEQKAGYSNFAESPPSTFK